MYNNIATDGNLITEYCTAIKTLSSFKRHLALNMCMALIILTINQLVSFNEEYPRVSAFSPKQSRQNIGTCLQLEIKAKKTFDHLSTQKRNLPSFHILALTQKMQSGPVLIC